MRGGLEDLQRIALKLFAADGDTVRPREVVPIFHRWIQTHALADHLLVDVADYQHVPHGPGVVLVAHEGNFSLDLGGGRLGLLYTRKAAASGPLPDRLHGVVRTALAACRLLEEDSALGGRLRFRGDELALFANDRLHAPNTPDALAALQPALHALLHTLYGGAACTITPETDRRARLGVHVKAPRPIGIDALIENLKVTS